MDEYGGGGGGSMVGPIIMMLVMGVVFLAVHLFMSFCMKKVCEKVGKDPGIMIWIPIVQLLPIMEVAGMQTWMIVLAILPIANIVFAIMLILGLAKARNKNPGLVFAIAIFCGIAFWPYMAFSE